MILHSIRWRLQLWLAFLLAGALTGFGVAVYQLERLSQFDQVDQELERRVAVLSAELRARSLPDFGPGRPPFERGPGDREGPGPRRPPPGRTPEAWRSGGGPPERPPVTRELVLAPEVLNLFDEADTNGFYFALFARNGAVFRRSLNAPADLSVPPRTTATLTQTRFRAPFREAYYFSGLNECVLVGRSVAADRAALRRLLWWLLASGGTAMALGLGGGWWLTTQAIRPIDEISAAAAKIAAGDLAQRINTADTDNELGRLASVLNSTFARLEAAFAQQARFTADAAHELRTPVTVILTHVQNALATAGASDEHREAFEACQRAAQRMRRLIESLLQLARLDAGQEPIARAPLDLAAVARTSIELVQPLADQRGIEIEHRLVPAVECRGDAEHLGQVITNLLMNALEYSPPRGRLRVAAASRNHEAILTVADQGPGIPAKDLPHIFGRFYRGDVSRSRRVGHAGLGLAISNAIVEAHGGTLEVASTPGQGSTFTLRLPTADRDTTGSAPSVPA